MRHGGKKHRMSLFQAGLVAIVVIAIAILKLGQSAHLFTKRYTLVSFVPNTAGLRVGGQVTVAGQLAGSVKSIEFLPVDADTTRNLKVVIEVDQEVLSGNRLTVANEGKAGTEFCKVLGDFWLGIACDSQYSCAGLRKRMGQTHLGGAATGRENDPVEIAFLLLEFAPSLEERISPKWRRPPNRNSIHLFAALLQLGCDGFGCGK